MKTGFNAARVGARLDDLTFHDLRRAAATRLGDAGANAFYIQQTLGHVDVGTARIYAGATDAGSRRAMETLAGRSGTDAIVHAQAAAAAY